MSDPKMTIRSAPGYWVIRAGGAVIGETRDAVELIEDGHDPVIYFPRADAGEAFLEKTDQVSSCPHKGQASYYSIIAKSGPIANAAWSYDDPLPGAEAIRGRIAFYPDKATVERL